MIEKRIQTPLTDTVVEDLRAGYRVWLSGIIYTARDQAHKRLVEALDKGNPLPFDLKGQVIYFVGPTPPRPGSVIGSAGPTTSYRMDAYSPTLMAYGLKGMIGKGARSQPVIEAMKKYKCVYFAATGGAGALISKKIKEATLIAYEDLGPEGIYRLRVEDLPLLVANDIYGNDLYQEGIKAYCIKTGA